MNRKPSQDAFEANQASGKNKPVAKPSHEAAPPLSGQDPYSPFVMSRDHGNSGAINSLTFVVPNMNCAGCMAKIEKHFATYPGLLSARANLARKEVVFNWQAHQPHTGGDELSRPLSPDELKGEGLPAIHGTQLEAALTGLGFDARPLMVGDDQGDHEAHFRYLLWCLAVAGFAAANVMLLSVSVWSGAAGATRDLFHWLSALIALPAIAYAGRPFFNSAWQALKAGHVNMDVPISLAVVLASGLSLFETIQHGEHAFFDAAICLLFFLLIGRTLDHLMRAKAFQGVRQLLALRADTTLLVQDDGKTEPMAVNQLQPGMRILVRPGETVPIDGVVVEGVSDVDWSLVTGESQPQTTKSGDDVYGGILNITGPLMIETRAVGENTLLSEIISLMEAAQSAKPRYRQLAERAAGYYVPLVHSAAALTFAGWLLAGLDWQVALYHAIAVLIITCPCALGLAVPVVQVVASSLAQRAGVLMKEGAALELLSEADTVVFDKTGTLTTAKPELAGYAVHIDERHAPLIDELSLKGAIAQLAGQSLHPLSVQLSTALKRKPLSVMPLETIEEHPGLGLCCSWQGGQLRLGSRGWCGVTDLPPLIEGEYGFHSWASFKDPAGNLSYAVFAFEDQLREGAEAALAHFQRQGLDVYVFSGDRGEVVAHFAKRLGIKHSEGDMKPADKAAAVSALEASGRRVLMVGDGLNDGPSLKSASVSLSPAEASDLAKVSASFVLLSESFRPLIWLHRLARYSRLLIVQNFLIAAIYNLIAVPLAVMGGVTPIVAALAMSGSSLIVMGNALRLYYLVGEKHYGS